VWRYIVMELLMYLLCEDTLLWNCWWRLTGL
jgi:hypothetical protein